MRAEVVYVLEMMGIIYLFEMIKRDHCHRYGVSDDEFFDMDAKYGVLNYVLECREGFEDMSEEEILADVEGYLVVKGGGKV